MNRILSLSLLLLPLCFVSAEVKISGDTKAKVYEFVRLQAMPEDTTAGYTWKVYDKERKRISAKSAWVKDGKLVFVAQPGTYTVELVAFRYDEKAKRVIVEEAETVVTIEGTGPTPPGPDPKPPEPDPDNPAPIPVDGFRVLIVEETAERAKLPAKQLNILFDKSIRDYLRAKCADSGKEWAIWDKDVDTSNEPKLWHDVMKRPRKSVPWLVISNGKTGYEGPLPGTVEETLKLLKQYGG